MFSKLSFVCYIKDYNPHGSLFASKNIFDITLSYPKEYPEVEEFFYSGVYMYRYDATYILFKSLQALNLPSQSIDYRLIYNGALIGGQRQSFTLTNFRGSFDLFRD